MVKETNKKEAKNKKTNSPACEWTTEKIVSYISFLYKQNNRLWQEVTALGSAVNELEAKARGEY